MTRPTLEVADIIRHAGNRYVERNRSHLAWPHLKVLRAIRNCRTAALGGYLDECSDCGHRAIFYNSCRNRHCPKCQTQARDRWVAARSQELLPVPYLHVVFTLPHALCPLVLQNKRLLYDLLFRASAETLLEIAADPKHFGAEIGFLSVLHTWGQTLQAHPHVHCVLPAGGLSPDRLRWVHPNRHGLFLPIKALRKTFRGKFFDALKRLFRNHELAFHGALQNLASPKLFRQFLRCLHRTQWVVYAKKPFGGPEHVLRYLARYTHRVAISNHRLLDFDGERMTFRWKDYAHGSKQRKMTLTSDEFLRRFLLHLLPTGFVRIRHYGFLANRGRQQRVSLCRQLLATDDSPRAPPAPAQQPYVHRCPVCSASMHITARLTSQQIASAIAGQQPRVDSS